VTALPDARPRGCLRSEGGTTRPADRWLGPLQAADLDVLARAEGPVLDIGCGPARHVLALARRGVPALGIDITLPALDLARRRGAPVLHRSVFDRVPGAGRWACALLLDGNLGIGDDPVALLSRAAALVRADGIALVEVEPPGSPPASERVRLEIGGVTGPWFGWARVGVDHLADVAARSGFAVAETWHHGSRWFGRLARTPQP